MRTSMSPSLKKSAKVCGFTVGLALIIAAIIAIARSAPTLDHLRAVIVHPDWMVITAAACAALASVAAGGGMFHALVRRHGRISLFEMQRLIAASSVLNYLPLRPGLVGRIAYQQVVCEIPLRRSTLSIVEAAVLCAVSIVWLAFAVALVQFTQARVIGGVVAALPVFTALAYAWPSEAPWRVYCEALFWRWIDLLAWTVRYAAVFALLGIDLTPESAAAAACIAASANMIPFVGNGLGVREWAIGLAGPALATWTTDIGLAAELLNRAIDLVVVVPIGCASLPSIARAMRTATASQPRSTIAS